MQPSSGPDGHAFIVSAARTPIGKFGGSLSSVPAVELGAVAIRAAVDRSGLPADARIDEVIMGQVLQGGAGQAPARQALLRAQLADTTSATTINRVCGSGLKSIMFSAAGIRAGDGDVYVAGAMESGPSFASASAVVSRRGLSPTATTVSRPLASRTVTWRQLSLEPALVDGGDRVPVGRERERVLVFARDLVLDQAAGRPLWDGDPLPGRRRLGRDGVRAGLTPGVSGLAAGSRQGWLATLGR